MKIGVVGTGYVGAVQGAGMAHLGHEVVSVDIDPVKIEQLQKGIAPIHEPGLSELIESGIAANRLIYTTDYGALALHEVEAVFLCLPTPPNEDGSADLTYLLSAAESIAGVMKTDTVLVNKSTVPTGSAEKVAAHVAPFTQDGVTLHVASNPEFLREGSAVADFLEPSSIIIGTDSAHALSVMRNVYASFDKDILFETDPRTAELIKYGRNGFRSVKITFMNNMTEVAHQVGANIDDLMHAMTMDPVVGEHFVSPGPGWGGSCFPKDSRALLATAQTAGVPFEQLERTMVDNERHKGRVVEQILTHFGKDIMGKKIAVLGAAFKANTDDIRESPAIHIIQLLAGHGAEVTVYDPQAMENAQKYLAKLESVSFADSALIAAKDADSIVIATEWPEFSAIEIAQYAEIMRDRVIFDARNLFDPKDDSTDGPVADMRKHGFTYKSFGRQDLTPNE
ncbi:MAG TPA: UDP-glucose/GDP-mannose dehydrogenase family protein [Candidatus Saccharibacteria bacterium]|nr:UDP-glucose/GDP-mannose dehydrogenase family protein [Candidatus Saccharibacteria bacterium]HMT55613.1 UDP-glucose/GDP-mannose dehydrogenase family protein [Candidatus Saccharibacteria bacterium]